MSPGLSPYAPPRTPLPDTGTLDVNRKEAIPLVCLKCATQHEVLARAKTLLVVKRARLFTLFVALVGGITVANVRTPETRMYVFFGIAVAAFIVNRFAYPRVELGVPLCASCAHRWDAGVRWSKIFRGLILFFAVTMTAATYAGVSVLLAFVFAVGIFGAGVGQLLLRIRKRIVVIKELKGDLATIALVHPDAVAAIRSARE
jgi:hypothetical protein